MLGSHYADIARSVVNITL